MHDPGGGGGLGGTDWTARDVHQMWSVLANQETTPHWDLVSGWRKSYELTSQHLGRVKDYREKLAAAWPPERSPAAAAYVARLDALIDSLQRTYDAAVANYDTFGAVTGALSTSRHELKRIYDEYVANEGKIAEYEHRRATTSPRGRYAQPVGGSRPPVSPERQEQLTYEARRIMFQLSSEVTQARSRITKPPEYRTPRPREDSPITGTFVGPPPIPPIVPLVERTSRGVPPATSSPLGVPSPTGPILGGTSPGSATTPPVSAGGAPPLPPPATGTPGGIIAPPYPGVRAAAPGLRPGGSPTIGPAPPVIGNPNATNHPMPLGAPSGRSVPPGGVIGGVPSSGGAHRGTAGNDPRRASPFGGVIGTGASSSALHTRGRRAGSGSPMFEPSIPRSGDATRRRRWDPDNPWETEQGVAPVVLPPIEKHFDPGPAIGFKN
jgi:hypothetical protein